MSIFGVYWPIFLLLLLISLFIIYIFGIIAFSFYFARKPRSIYPAVPEFGIVEDLRIKSMGKEIELWVVRQQQPTENTVIVTHAWGRDRGRYVCRAEKWFNMGFNTIILSARDHGKSDKMFTGMNLLRFKEDVEATVNWWNKPVFLHGHSAGGGASILVGAEHPLIRAVVAESPPRVMTSGLNEFFKPFSRAMTKFMYFGTKLVFRLLFIRYKDYEINPIMKAARSKTPMMMIYALDDEIFNDVPRMVKEWEALPNVEVAVFDHGKHSTISKQPNYNDILEKFVKKHL
ncbi:MAG: alpha/beta hydrolase [Candidatus Heimdallarchaeota archaeon]|nr:alpha/beta hydrolase [Candidatus Heimdallarchaeota archaeon]